MVNRALLVLTGLTFTTCVMAQKMPSDYLAEGNEFFEKQEYDKALKRFSYIVKNHTKNEIYPRAYYNLGVAYYNLKKADSSAIIFRHILQSNFNEKENLGGSIMDDPFTNYRHRASSILSDIHFEKGNYDSALYYLALSDTAYPYLHFCGNEYASNGVYKTVKYAEIYDKLGNTKKATELLLKQTFIYADLASTQPVVSKLKEIFERQSARKRKKLVTKFNEALNDIRVIETRVRESIIKTSVFTFMGVEIEIWQSFDSDEEKNEIITEARQSLIYQMLLELANK